jgi:hypothetical protein
VVSDEHSKRLKSGVSDKESVPWLSLENVELKRAATALGIRFQVRGLKDWQVSKES